MAANTVLTTVKINADTSQAKSQIQDMFSSLSKIANMQPLKFDTAELKNGVEGARNLQKALQAAADVNLGKINMSAFSRSLKQSNTDLKTIHDQMASFGASGEAAFSQVANGLVRLRQQTAQVNGVFGSLLTNLKKTAQWQISSTIIHGFVGKLQAAVGYAKDLNESLNNIQKVTQMNTAQLANFADEAQRVAKTLSSSTLAFSDAALIYFQQGDQMTTAMKKAEITMKAAAVSFNSNAKEMSEYLTAIWNSYKVGENEMQHYVDIMANLGAHTASSMEEISTALKKVAATANNVGVSMEQMSTIIATSASVTRQSAEIVGTAWNTILSRIGGLKLGEVLEDGVDLNKYSKALQTIGVSVLDASGDLRDMGKVLDEVGEKWSTLTKAQQSALAQTIGGTRQYTQMMAFFENYKTYKVNLEFAENSEGTLNKQFSTWEKSWEAATGRMKNAWQGLYKEIIDDQSFIQLTDSLTTVINRVTDLIHAMGGIAPIIQSVAGLFLANFGASGKISAAIEKFASNFAIITGAQTKADIGIQKQLEESYSTKAASSVKGSAEQAIYQSQAQQSATEATYLKNARYMSEDQRKEYQTAQDRVIAKRDEVAAAEQARKQEAFQLQMQRQSKGSNAARMDYVTKGGFSTQEGRDAFMETTGTVEKSSLGNATALSGVKEQVDKQVGEIKVAYSDLVQAINTGNQDAIDAAQSGYAEATGKASTAGKAIVENMTKEIAEVEDVKAKLANAATDSEHYANSGGEFDAAKAKSTIGEITGGNAAAQNAAANVGFDMFKDADSYKKGIAEINNALTTYQDQCEGAKEAGAALIDTNGESGKSFVEQSEKTQQATANVDGLKEELKESNEDLKELGEKTTPKLSDGFGKLAGGAMQMRAGLMMVSSAFNTLSDEGASGMQKLMAVLSLVAGSVSLVNGATQAMNGLRSISLAITKMQTKEETKGIAAKLGNAAAQGIQTLATWAQIAAQTILNALTGQYGKIIAAAAVALIAMTAAIIAAVAGMINYNKQMEKLHTEMDELTKKSESLKQKQEQNISVMQKLSQVMNATGLTVEEQLEQINELTAAYGIQATALDVLSGNYGELAANVETAMLAAQEEITADLQDIEVQQQENIRQQIALSDAANLGFWDKVDRAVDQFQVNIVKAIGELARLAIHAVSYIVEFVLSIPEKIINAFIALINGIISLINKIPFVNIGHIDNVDFAFDNDAGQAIRDFGDQVRDTISGWGDTLQEAADAALKAKGAFNKLGDSLTISAEEAEKWKNFANDNVDALREAGFLYNYQTGKLEVDTNAEQDWGKLYNLLEQNGVSNWGGVNGYGSTVMGYLRSVDADQLGATQNLVRQSQIVEQMYSTFSDQIDALNLNNTTKNLKDMHELIKKINDANGGSLTDSDRSYIASTLGGYEHWSTAQQQYEAVIALSAKVQSFDVNSALSKEDVTNALIEACVNGKVKTSSGNIVDVDTDVLLRVRPSAITIDPTTSAVTVDEHALAIATAQSNSSNAATTQANIESVRKLDKNDTIDYATYKSIQETGLFTEEELDAYAHSSPAERALILKRREQEAINDEIAANETIVAEGQQEIDTLTAQIEDFNQRLYEALSNDSGITPEKYPELFDEDGKLLEGDALYRAMASKQSKLKTLNTAYKEFNSQWSGKGWEDVKGDYSTWATGLQGTLSKDQQQQIMSDFGIKDWATMTEDQAKKVFEAMQKGTYTFWATNNSQLEWYNEQLAEGTTLVGELGSAQAAVTNANNNINAGQYAQWARDLEDATNAANKFNSAIGKTGKLSAEDLIALSEFDDEVIRKYNTMSAAEWDRYAYEQAMNYYNQMAILYSNDEAMLTEITQKKDALTKSYYDAVKERVNAVTEAIKEMRDEELSAIQNALKLLTDVDLTKGFTNFSQIEKLRQALLEVGYTAEEVDRLIKNIGREDAAESEEAIWAKADAQIALALKGQHIQTEQLEEARSLYQVDVEISDAAKPIWNVAEGRWNTLEGVTEFTTTGGETYRVYVEGEDTYSSLWDTRTGKWRTPTKVDPVEVGGEKYLLITDTTGMTYTSVWDSEAKTWRKATQAAPVVVGGEEFQIIVSKTGDPQGFRYDDASGTWKPIPGIVTKNVSQTYTVKTDTGEASEFLYKDGKWIEIETPQGWDPTTEQTMKLVVNKDDPELQYFYDGLGHWKELQKVNGGEIVMGFSLVFDKESNQYFKVDSQGRLTPVDAQEDAELLQAFGIEIGVKPGVGMQQETDGSLTPVVNRELAPITQLVTTQYDDSAVVQGMTTTKYTELLNYDADEDYWGDINSGWLARLTQGYGGNAAAFFEMASNKSDFQAGATGRMSQIAQNTMNGYRLAQSDVEDIYLLSQLAKSGNISLYDLFTNGATKDKTYSGGEAFEAVMVRMFEYFTQKYDGKNTSEWAGSDQDLLATFIDSWSQYADEYDMVLKADYKRKLSEGYTGYSSYSDAAEIGYGPGYYRYDNKGIELKGNSYLDTYGFTTMRKRLGFENASAYEHHIDYDSELATAMDWDQAQVDLNNAYSEFMRTWVESSVHDKELMLLWSSEGMAQAKQLLAGFLQGLPEDALTPIMQALGFESIAALKAALGIQSPSKYTREMGHYLMEGLSIGVQETEFNPGDLGGRVLNSIKEQLKDVNIEDVWRDLGYDDMMVHVFDDLDEQFGDSDIGAKLAEDLQGDGTIDSLTEQQQRALLTWANGHKKEGRTEDYTMDDWAQMVEDEVFNGITAEDLIQEAQTHTKEGILKRLKVTVRQVDDGWVIDGSDIDEVFESQEAAENAAAVAAYGEKKVADYLNGGFWDDENLTEVQRSLMDSLISNTVKKLGYNSVEEFTQAALSGKANWDDFWTEFDNQYNDSVNAFENTVKLTWTDIKDYIKTALDELEEYDQTKAEEYYDRWKNVFTAVGILRKAAFSGNTDQGMQDLLSDSQLADMIENYAYYEEEDPNNPGRTIRKRRSQEEIREYISNPTNVNNTTQEPLSSFHSSGYYSVGDARFLNTSAITGLSMDTTGRQMYENARQYYTDRFTSSGAEHSTFVQNMEQMAALAQYGKGTLMSDNDFLTIYASEHADFDINDETQRKAALSIRDDALSMITSGLLDEKGTFHYDGKEFDASSMRDEVIQEIIRQFYLNGDYEGANAIAWDNRAYSALDTAAAAEGAYQKDLKAQLKTEQEAKITEAQNKQTLMQNAYQNGKDSLSPAEQKQLMEYFGVQSLDDVTDDMLLQANRDLATEAQSAADALSLITQAINDGFTLNDEGHWVKDNGDGTTTDLGETKDLGQTYTSQNTEDYGAQAETTNLTMMASAVDMTTTEFKNLATSIKEAGGDMRDLDDLSADERQELYKLTKQVAETANAWDDLTSSQSDNISMIKKGEKANVNYKTGLQAVMKDVKTIFNNSEHVTETFVEDNIDLIEDMANGVEGAAEKVEEAVLRAQADAEGWDYDTEIKVKVDVDNDGVADELGTMGELINNFGDQYADIPVGVSIDDTAALAAMTEMLNSGQMTAEQMEEAFNSVGWDPEIEWNEYTLTEEDVGRGYVEAPVIDPITGEVTGYQQVPIQSDYEAGQTIRIPSINGGSGGTFKKTGSGASSGVKPTTTSSSGGGGGGSKTTKDKKDATDEIERYHVISEQLGIIQRALTKIDKLKSAAWGAGKLKAINDEIAALEREADVYAAYAEEAADWLAQDQAALSAEGATFNDDGSLANYTSLMQQWVDEYNAAVEAFNASEQTDADQDAFDKAEELYEDRKKMIENYEESYQTYQEQINNYLDTLNKLSAARLEKITYKVELQVELNESDRKVIDYFNKKLSDSLSTQSESMSKYIEKQKSYESDAKEYADAIAKLEEEHQKWIDSGGTEGINDSDYATTLKDYRDKLTQTLSDMYENEQKIKQVYSDAISKANEELSEHTNIISHTIDMMNSYIEIMGLLGKKVTYDDLKDFYDTQYSAALSMIKVSKERADVWQKEMDYYAAKEAAGIELSEIEQEQYKKAKEEYISAQNDLVANTKTALENLREAHQAYTDQVLDDLSRINTGSKATIQDVSDAYNNWNEETSRYLATGKQLYEVNKLNRKIEDSIADASTKASKERLAALQDVINAQAKNNKLTEYSIKQFEYQYELALAMQELEEAQNAKSTVRLVRDENGGYGYQYTADQDSLDAAEQHYEDVLENIRQLTADTADQMAQGYINARITMEQKLAELDESDFKSHEEYLAKRDEIIEYYSGQMGYYSEQYSIVVGDLQQNLLALSGHYGEENISVSEEMKNTLNDDVEEMMDNHDEYVSAVQEAIGLIDEEYDNYHTKIDEITSASGLDFASMISSLDGFKTQTEQAQAAAESITTTLETELDQIHDVTEEWDDHKAKIEDTIDSYEELIDNLGDVLDDLADLQAALDEINDSDTTHVTATTTTTTTPSPSADTGSGGNGGNGDSGGGNNPSDTQTPEKHGWKVGGIQPSGSPGQLTPTYDSKSAAESAKTRAAHNGWTALYINQIYKKGGLIDFTGPAWVDGTESEPELMLNAQDTFNLLTAIEMLRDITPSIMQMFNAGALMMTHQIDHMAYASQYAAAQGMLDGQALEQEVHITAEFPNVTDRYEIEEAFNSLIDQTAQYINRKVY